MFEFPMFPEQVLRTEAALYGCGICPEGCPDDDWGSIPGGNSDSDGYGY